MDSAEAYGEAQPAFAPADSNGQSGRRHQPLTAAFHDRCVLCFFAGMLWFRFGPITNVQNPLLLCCLYSSDLHYRLILFFFILALFSFLSECTLQLVHNSTEELTCCVLIAC